MTAMSEYQRIKALDDQYVMHTYKRMDGLFVRGQGCSMWDSEGNEYLDFLAGIAVCQLGHCHPAVVSAISNQANTLMHTSNYLLNEPMARLAEKLCKLSGMDKTFFVVDGTVANETALKIAKRHGLMKCPSGDYEIISLMNSFHGRSLGSLTATAQSKYQDQFRPLLPGFRHIPINDVDALRAAFSEKTAAIVFEPIQGEGGVMPVTEEFAREARALCDRFNAFLIIDEVQTGIGRTGKWFAFQHLGVVPDVLCLAKALGSGMPIGACLARGEASQVFVAGDHGSTFGGSPLSCAAGLAVLETIEKEDLIGNAERMGALLSERMRNLGDPVAEVRGKGLMVGARLNQPIARQVVSNCLEKRLITNATDDFMLRLVPPLIVNADQIERAVGIFAEVLGALNPSVAAAV